MSPTKRTIHVVDPDSNRRAYLAHNLMSNRIHTEIYEGLWEFVQTSPNKGAVLAFDDRESGGAAEILDAVERQGGCMPVTIYAAKPTAERVVMAMKKGAFSYLCWPLPDIRLISTIRQMFLKSDDMFARQKVMHQAKRSVSSLSPREHQVLTQIVEGLSNKEVALRLGISPRTVEIHRGNMMTKLNAHSTAEAVRIALYAGLDNINLLQLAA